MSKTPPILADLPPEVQALFAAQAAELGRKDAEMLGLSLSHATAQKRLRDDMTSVDAALSAERTAHASAIQNRDTIIADLRLQFHGHKKHRFGSKSESCAQLALELILEELEIEQAAPFQRVLWGPRCWPTSCAANTGITCRSIARARCLPMKALI